MVLGIFHQLNSIKTPIFVWGQIFPHKTSFAAFPKLLVEQIMRSGNPQKDIQQPPRFLRFGMTGGGPTQEPYLLKHQPFTN